MANLVESTPVGAGPWFNRLAAGITLGLSLVLSSLGVPGVAVAQRAAEIQTGRWAVAGPDLTLYSAAIRRDAWGPFGYGLRGMALVVPDSGGRSLYGVAPEAMLLRRYRGSGLGVYAVGGAGLALEGGDGDGVVALWNAGLGLELKAPSIVSAGIEVRRFAEDRGFRGAWDLADDDRQGWLLSVGVSIRWGGDPTPPGRVRPADGSTSSIGASNGGPLMPAADLPEGDRRRVTSAVVETALEAMGEPYRWGGTGTDEGFDCSGLVWYAYTTNGVRVPRVSRDQARAGRRVPADVSELLPGDILLFSNRPGAVTHVGLYVGDAEFIHATTSGGVRIGTLSESEADGTTRWYLSRWVGARRVLE